MSTTFMQSPKLLFTSESVTEGHPDKMCDQISDAVLDSCLEQDPYSRVACETATKTGYVMLLGEITTQAFVNFDELVRKVVVEIGYDRAKKGFDGNTCGVLSAIASQSPDIDMGVSKSLEAKEGDEAELDKIGAGDQGMMFGYACNETPTLMPMPIFMAHKLTRCLAEVRKKGDLEWLRPDGKSQVTVEYAYGKPKRIDTVLISTQHAPDISQEDIRQAVIDRVIMPTLPPDMVDDDLKDLRQPHRPLRDRRPVGRCRRHWPQNYRRYLRRDGPPRRRRVLRQRPHESGPLRCLRRALGRQERGRRRAGRPV